MANPFDPFARFPAGVSVDPFSSYASMFAPRGPSARELLPEIDPESQQSTAGWLLEQGLGGLGYVGSVLDKAFGGRALRGLIGGKPQELLSVIPLSDTLGITDQANEVSGRDILADAGIARRRNPDEAFGWDDAYGMAAEMLLDPSTYFSLGLTGAGKQALKSGGRSALEKGMDAQMRAGQRGLNIGIPFTSIESNVIPGPQTAEALSWLRSGATLPTRGVDALLGATTGYRPLQGAQRAIYDYGLEPTGRFFSQLFDTDVKNRLMPESQSTARAVSEFEKPREWQARSDMAGMKQWFDDMLPPDATPADRDLLQRSFRANVEYADPMELFAVKQKESKERAVGVIEKWLSPANPGYKEDRANLTQWSRGKEELNANNQRVFDLEVPRVDQAFVEGVFPSKTTDMLQAMPNRERFMAEASKVWGQEGTVAYMPVMDAFAKRMAKKLNVTPDDYYKSLYSREGGTPGRGALKQEPAGVWYSKLARVTEEKMQGPMDADAYRKMLANNGVKPEEMEWSGINELSGKLTPEQVREHLAENAVEVKEAWRGQGATIPEFPKAAEMDAAAAAVKEADSAYARFVLDNKARLDMPSSVPGVADLQRQRSALYSAVTDARDRHHLLKQEALEHERSYATKYHEYQTPGGESYKELLLTLPSRQLSKSDAELLARGRKSQAGLTDEEFERFAKLDAGEAGQDYISPHWDEPNVLANIRMNDRVSPDGKKTLFIEEIQSDWHQKGRDKGYNPDYKLDLGENPWRKWDPPRTREEAFAIEKARAAALKDFEETQKNIPWRQQDHDRHGALLDEAMAASRDAGFFRGRNVMPGGVPDAPFKKNWEQLAMKRIMRYAAENGYDRVAWLPGAEQAKRYNLSSVIDEINWNTHQAFDPKVPDFIQVDLHGKASGDNYLRAMTMHVGKDGKIIIAGGFGDQNVVGKSLADVIGKEKAEQILASGKGKLAGDGLAFGDEGMKGFYDKKLVNSTNDLIKKYGAKVEPRTIGDAPKPRDVRIEEGFHGDGGALAYRATVNGEPIGPWEDTSRHAWLHAQEHITSQDRKLSPQIANAPGFDVTPQMKAEVMKGQPLFQDGQGSFEVTKSGQRIMRALEGANISTFAHESAHDMTYMLSRYDTAAADDLARAVGAADYASITKDQHELIARGWERYLRDGQAPLPALRRAFDAMKEFLMDIYRSIVGTPLEGKLNRELREQFDRLLKEGDDIPMPKDTGTVTLLDALRDRIDAGLLPEMLPGGSIRMAPNDEALRAARHKMRLGIRKDLEDGPKAFRDPVNDPTHDVSRAYSRELTKFEKDLNYDPQTLFADPRFGDAARRAFDKLADTPQYQRGMKLEKALEYTPPTNETAVRQWAEKNLVPEQKAEFDRMVGEVQSNLMQWKEIEKSVGSQGGVLQDFWTGYMPRQMAMFAPDDPRAAGKAMKQAKRDMKAANQNYEQREKLFQNVPGSTTTLDDWAVDPGMSGPNATMNPEQIEARIREHLTGTAMPRKGSPAWDQAKQLRQWLASLPEHHANDNVPFFSADIPNLIFARQKGMNDVLAVNKAAEHAVEYFAHNKAHFEELGQETMPVKELLERMNLGGADEGGSIWAQKLLAKTGVLLEEGQKATLKDIDLHLPRDVGEDILKMNDAVRAPEMLRPILDAVDGISAYTKTMLTRPFISFMTRNMFSDQFNTWRSIPGYMTENPARDKKLLQGVVDFLRGAKTSEYVTGQTVQGAAVRALVPKGANADEYAKTLGMAPGYKVTDELVPGIPNDQLERELFAGKIAFSPHSGQRSDILGAGGEVIAGGPAFPKSSGKTLKGDAVDFLKGNVQEAMANKKQGLNPFSSQNLWVKGMTEANNFTGDVARVNHYAQLRARGWAPQAAAEEVLKYQIDYTKATSAERGLFRRVFPWFAFSRGSLPTILSDLVDRPSNITLPMRLVTGGRQPGEFVPEWIGEGAALPIGEGESGTKRYISSFGLPVEDESFKVLGSLAKGDLTRAGEQVLGASFPWLKFPMEAIFGKQLYSGRPLEDLRPYEWAGLGGALNEKQARLLTEVISQTPASRFGSTASRLMDERKTTGDQFWNMLTGLRITDVDQDRAFNAAVTREIGSQLLGQPGVRSRQEVYVPIANIPNMRPEDAEKYAMYLAYEQRMRDLAKKRSQNQR